MNKAFCRAQLILILAITLMTSAYSYSGSWPGFLGSNRAGHSGDTGLIKQWPSEGPPLLWKNSNIGPGWSSLSVNDGRIYITGNSADKQDLICLDLKGKEKWRILLLPGAGSISGTIRISIVLI